MPSFQEREEVLFRAACELQSAEVRRAFLDHACADDSALRHRLEALLAAHEQAAPELESPALRRDELQESPNQNQGLAEIGPSGAAPRTTIKLDLHEVPNEAVGQKIGRYKLLERVGQGGCGVVYVAEQTEPVRRRVALKVIKLGMDTKQVVARFEAERQALAMMDHPNIAKVLDAGATETGRPYFIMELVRGIKITDYCDQSNLSTKDRLDLFIKVCQAIQHAHQKGIIHRDIKPSNILVTLHDGVPVPKVIDFGIAKATEGRLTDATVYTQLHQFIGTPAYMSPEQAEMSGLDIDTRSDIYSLGVLLYELLTGKTPFDANELMSQGIDAMRKTIREKDPVRPSTKLATLEGEERTTTAKRHAMDLPRLIHQLKGDLDWIVMKCLEKDRTRRYETANGLAMDLRRHLSHEPVNARPPSQLYRFQKLIRRNKVAFAGVAAVAVTLVLGALVSTGLAIRATRAEHEQNRLRQQAQAGERLAQHNLARQYLRRGQSLCAEGKVAPGLHWMARAHEASPAASVALRESIRENLAAWAERWQPPRAVYLHDSGVHAFAFSPDGRRLITGNHNGQVQFWSADTGERLPIAFKHDEIVRVIRFNPDGSRLFSASGDRSVRFSDARTGEALFSSSKQSGVVFQAAWSPDGSRVATGADDGTFALWNANDGKPVRVQPAPGSTINSLAFSQDGTRVVTGSSDKTARLWDGATGEPAGIPLRHPREVRFVCFSPQGERFATVGGDNLVRLWRTLDGAPLGSPVTHYDVSEAAFSPDGERLLTWGRDRAVRLWLTRTGEQWGNDMAHEKPMGTVAFNAEGTEVLTMGTEGRMQVWSVRTTEPLGQSRHQESPFSLAVATTNGWRVAGGLTGHAVTLRFLPSVSHNRPRLTIPSSGFAVAFSSDGRRLLVGDEKGKLEWRWLETGEVVPWKLGHERGIYFLTISADGRRALTTSEDNTARLWSLEGDEQLLQTFRHERPVRAAAFSPDGRFVATASFDRTARVWSADIGRPVGSPIQHPNMVEDVAFSPAGDLLATACGDGAARLWSVSTGQQVGPVMSHRGSVLGLKFSPDGKRLVTGSRDLTARFWSVATGQPTGMVLEHAGWVEDLCFTGDGRRLATVSDGKLQLWSVEAGELLGPPLEFEGGAWQVVFSADGLRIAASTVFNSVGVWTLPPALKTDLRQTSLWVQVLTWQEMDENGVLSWLDREAWHQRRQQLEKLGESSLR